MTPDETESTPLLHATNASAVSSQEGDIDRIATADFSEQLGHNRLASSYRRPSFVTGCGRGLILASSPVPESALRDDEAFDCVMEERELLKRNSIIRVPSGDGRSVSVTANNIADVEETWEEAVKKGKVKTSARHELGVIMKSSVFPALELD